MDKNIIRIPVDSSKFNDEKKVLAEKFLNDFFDKSYRCTFVFDEDGTFCLEILKK